MLNNEQLKLVFKKTSGHCHFCGDALIFAKYGVMDVNKMKKAWAVDHVIQKKKGGLNDLSNYLPICTECNRFRWHRKGEELRNLIFLGEIASRQIKNRTALGKVMEQLKNKRIRANKKRRRNSTAK